MEGQGICLNYSELLPSKTLAEPHRHKAVSIFVSFLFPVLLLKAYIPLEAEILASYRLQNWDLSVPETETLIC